MASKGSERHVHEVTVRVVDRKTGRRETTRAFPSAPASRRVARPGIPPVQCYSALLAIEDRTGATNTHWMTISVAGDGRVRVVAGGAPLEDRFQLAPLCDRSLVLEQGSGSFEYAIGERFGVSIEIGPREARKRLASRCGRPRPASENTIRSPRALESLIETDLTFSTRRLSGRGVGEESEDGGRAGEERSRHHERPLA